jgi:hypothetical protein
VVPIRVKAAAPVARIAQDAPARPGHQGQWKSF